MDWSMYEAKELEDLTTDECPQGTLWDKIASFTFDAESGILELVDMRGVVSTVVNASFHESSGADLTFKIGTKSKFVCIQF